MTASRVSSRQAPVCSASGSAPRRRAQLKHDVRLPQRARERPRARTRAPRRRPRRAGAAAARRARRARLTDGPPAGGTRSGSERLDEAAARVDERARRVLQDRRERALGGAALRRAAQRHAAVAQVAPQLAPAGQHALAVGAGSPRSSAKNAAVPRPGCGRSRPRASPRSARRGRPGRAPARRVRRPRAGRPAARRRRAPRSPRRTGASAASSSGNGAARSATGAGRRVTRRSSRSGAQTVRSSGGSATTTVPSSAPAASRATEATPPPSSTASSIPRWTRRSPSTGRRGGAGTSAERARLDMAAVCTR